MVWEGFLCCQATSSMGLCGTTSRRLDAFHLDVVCVDSGGRGVGITALDWGSRWLWRSGGGGLVRRAVWCGLVVLGEAVAPKEGVPQREGDGTELQEIASRFEGEERDDDRVDEDAAPVGEEEEDGEDHGGGECGGPDEVQDCKSREERQRKGKVIVTERARAQNKVLAYDARRAPRRRAASISRPRAAAAAAGLRCAGPS